MYVKSLMLIWVVALPSMATATAPPTKGEFTSPPTRIEWVRRGPGAKIRVTGTTTGSRHKEANATLQQLADIMDGLVTSRQHVVWHKITWRDGRIAAEAVAESATFANVATIAMRRFFPQHRSAGTGIKQIRRAPAYAWRVLIALTPPPLDKSR
jgi:hypothetical protein